MDDDRKKTIPVAVERRSGKDRKSSKGERKMPINRFYAHGDDPGPTAEELEFGLAVEAFKRKHHRPFPTFSEVLKVLQSLGYRKVAERSELP